MAAQYGKRIAGSLVRIPRYALTETVPGMIYEIQVTCNKPAPPELINIIRREFASRLPQVTIHHISIEDKLVRIQLSGSPIAWELILSLLPLIFTLAGLVILLIAVYGIISAIPSWAWALLAIGVITLFILPSIPIPAPPKKEVKK